MNVKKETQGEDYAGRAKSTSETFVKGLTNVESQKLNSFGIPPNLTNYSYGAKNQLGVQPVSVSALPRAHDESKNLADTNFNEMMKKLSDLKKSIEEAKTRAGGKTEDNSNKPSAPNTIEPVTTIKSTSLYTPTFTNPSVLNDLKSSKAFEAKSGDILKGSTNFLADSSRIKSQSIVETGSSVQTMGEYKKQTLVMKPNSGEKSDPISNIESSTKPISFNAKLIADDSQTKALKTVSNTGTLGVLKEISISSKAINATPEKVKKEYIFREPNSHNLSANVAQSERGAKDSKKTDDITLTTTSDISKLRPVNLEINHGLGEKQRQKPELEEKAKNITQNTQGTQSTQIKEGIKTPADKGKTLTAATPLQNLRLLTNSDKDSKDDNTPKDGGAGDYLDREAQESVKIFKNQFFNNKYDASDEENIAIFDEDSSEFENEEEEFIVKEFAVAHEDLIKQCASRLIFTHVSTFLKKWKRTVFEDLINNINKSLERKQLKSLFALIQKKITAISVVKAKLFSRWRTLAKYEKRFNAADGKPPGNKQSKNQQPVQKPDAIIKTKKVDNVDLFRKTSNSNEKPQESSINNSSSPIVQIPTPVNMIQPGLIVPAPPVLNLLIRSNSGSKADNLASNNSIPTNYPKIPKELIPKRVHINPIPKYKLTNTFWISQPDNEIKVDFEQLKLLFCAPANQLKEDEKRSPKTKSKKETFHILDPKKIQNISILYSGFANIKHELMSYLQTFETSEDLEFLHKLKRIVPNEEEIGKLKEYQDDIALLTAPERFLKELIKIPRVKERIESLLFKHIFETEFSETFEKISIYREPFTLLLRDATFRSLLRFILMMANFLNDGSLKGNSVGFTVDSLGTLESLRGYDKRKKSLLAFIVSDLKKQGQTKVFQFVQNVQKTEAALKIDISDLDHRGSEFMEGFNKIREEIELLQRGLKNEGFTNIFSPEELLMLEKYISYFSNFSREASKKIQMFTKQLEELKTDIKQTGELYGEPKDFKSITFLSSIFNFTGAFRSALNKLEAEELVLHRKQKEQELEKVTKQAEVKKQVIPSESHQMMSKRIVVHERKSKGFVLSSTARNTIRSLKKGLREQKEEKEESRDNFKEINRDRLIVKVTKTGTLKF